MSIIQIVCISILAVIVAALNIACIVIAVKEEDWEMIPPPLFGIAIAIDLMALFCVFFGALGAFG